MSLKRDETRELTDLNWHKPKASRYFNVNTVDPDYDLDGSQEFGDADGDLAGLTIVEPGSVLASIRFLNGYAVL